MNAVLKTLPPTQTNSHRQNRRRERPGSRTRRTVSRKNAILYDCTEGLFDARDSTVLLPSDRSRPSPLLRQSFDQSWARWKAREAEEAAAAARVRAQKQEQAQIKELDKLQQEQMALRALFGGDELDDDELRRLGILYDDEVSGADLAVDALPPRRYAAPEFIIRPGKLSRRRTLKRSTWESLSLYLSFSALSQDDDIARLLISDCDNTPTPSVSSTIQHHETESTLNSSSLNSPDVVPQSLPTPESAPINTPLLESAMQSPARLSDSLPALSLPSSNAAPEDWTFVNTRASSTVDDADAGTCTPAISEPETWVLLNDDS